MAKTNKEKTEWLLNKQRNFFAWEPSESIKPFQMFRCWLIEPYHTMTEEQCRARAFNPQVFEATKGYSGCSNRCPRWRHYRAEATKPVKIPIKQVSERVPKFNHK